MEHTKHVETTHTIELKVSDILALLNRPPRAVQVPPTAEIISGGRDSETFARDEIALRVRWKETSK